MKKLHHYTTLLCVLLTLTATNVQGQTINENTLFYHSFHQPAANNLNPTMFPSGAGWYVSLPRVGMGFSLPISYNDLGLTYDPQRDATVLNINHVVDKLETNGTSMGLGSDIDLVGFGIRFNEFASINIRSGIRTTGNLTVPIGLLEFIEQGNAGETKHFDFGAQEMFNLQSYAYVSLGGGWKIPELPISVGARVNAMNGIQHLSVDNLSLTMTTAEDISSIQVSSDFLAHSAGIAGLSLDDSNRLTANPQLAHPNNWGFSIDLGMHAKIGMFDLSLSLLDLSDGICWQDNPLVLVPTKEERTLTFDGVDLTEVLHGGQFDTTLLSRMADTLSNMYQFTSQPESYYYHNIPTRLYFGASATLLDMIKVGYLFHGEWDKKALATSFRMNNTLSAHAFLLNWLEVSVANSFTFDGQHMTLFNPGASVTLSTAAWLQFYVAADFMSSIYLTDMKAGHFYVGLNLVGRKN